MQQLGGDPRHADRCLIIYSQRFDKLEPAIASVAGITARFAPLDQGATAVGVRPPRDSH